MQIEWKDEQVNDSSGGITDLVTASGSEFQELCENLCHNPKLQLLSSREGYRRFTNAETVSPIRQLFKLEDWILALCENGQVYYRLESDTISAWTMVETPKDRSQTVFRIYDSQGKGVTLLSTTGAFDQLVVKAGNNAGTTPDATFTNRTLTLTVQTSDLNSDKTYNTGSGNLKWSWFEGSPFTTYFTITKLSGTLSTNDVRFDGMLAPESVASGLGIYPASLRSDGAGTSRTFAAEDGHLQASDWQAHLYLALEPYIKTFTAHASDPYGEDPDQFPPTNQRLPLRKIAPLQPAIGSGSSAVALKAMNAQLPKVYIGLDATVSGIDSSAYTATSANYRYQVYRLRWDYMSGAYLNDETATIEIYCERTWGRIGVPADMPDYCYLNPAVINSKNLMNASAPFFLADYNTKAIAPWDVANIPNANVWGMLHLCYHQFDSAGTLVPAMTYTEVVTAIQAAFTEYQTRMAEKTGFAGTYYYAAYRNFGFYIKVNTKAKQYEQLNVLSAPFMDYWYTDSLPEDVAGNHTYGYAAYLRNSYKGAFEGSPREFLFDGPAAFLTVKTLSPIGLEPVAGYSDPARADADKVTFSTMPTIYAGISASIGRTTDLHFQSQMEMIFARTLDGGEVYYQDEASKYWWRTSDVPTTAALMADSWDVRTAYIAPHQGWDTDEELQLKAGAYFNGGILSYDSLPQGPFYFTITGAQTGYYAHIVGNIQRVYQAVPGIPHASPATLFEDFEDEMTGLASFQDKPIVTTQNRISRIEGTKAADGTGRTFLRTVSDEFGCISNQSIVQTNVGLFLWSNSGIIYTDGLRALRVNEHLISRYQTWLSNVRGGQPTIGPEQLRGSFDALNRRVYWSLKDEEGKPFFVVLSLQKGVSATMPIVTESGIRFNSVDDATGDITPADYFETHATLYSQDHQAFYRGQDTFLMIRDPERTYDESHEDTLKHPILPYYKSIAYAYGIPWARKQTSKILLNLRDLTKTGVSLCPLGWNDLSETPHELGNCLSFQHMEFALDYATASKLDLEMFFRSADAKWKSDTVVSYKRHFGKGSQRNLFKQIGFQALKLRYAAIDDTTTGVTNIELIHKAKDGTDFAEETVFIEITGGGTAVADLGLDKSGQFYVTWNDTMQPAPISDVDLVSSPKRIIVLPGGSAPTNVSDHTESWPRLSFYRVFTDQKIDMLGYNLTFRLIGDRTHGSLKSTDNGGRDA